MRTKLWKQPVGAVAAVLVVLALTDVSRTQPGPAAQPGFDKFNDPLPTGALQRLGTTRFRHGSRVQCLVYSPDGKTLAAAGGDDVIRMWDAQTGKLNYTLPLTWVQALAFSKDGKYLATAGAGKSIVVWDMQSAKAVATLPGSAGPVRALAFALDDAVLVSGGQDKVVHVWDWKTQKERLPMRGHEDEVTSLIVLPDGATVISGSGDYTVRYWNIRTGAQIRTCSISAGVTALALDPTGKMMACASDDGILHFLDAAKGTETLNWGFKDRFVHALHFKKDGKTLISASADNLIAVWDLGMPGQEPVHKFSTLPGDAEAMALAADDDTVVYAGQNHTIHRYSLAQKKELTATDGPQGAILSLAVSPDEKYLAFGDSAETVCVIETATNKEVHRWKVPHTKDVVLAFSPTGKVLAASSGAGNVQLWDMASGKEHQLLAAPGPDQVMCLAFSPADNTLAVGYRKGGIRLWDTSGKVKAIAHPEGIYALAYSHDGKLLAAAGIERVAVWKMTSGEKWHLLADKQRAASLAFSPDGKTLATGHFDSTINLWNLADGKRTTTYEGHGSAVYSLMFSSTGRRLLSGSYDKTIRVWETFSNGQVASWSGPTGPVYSVAFSPDGRRAYSGSADTSILVWDVTKRSPGGKLTTEKLTQAQLEGLWNELASTDTTVGHRALWSLIAGGDEAIAFLQKRVYLLDRNELEKLITDLDSEKFMVRAKATKALEGYGLWIKGRLQESSKTPKSVEQKLRLDQLLEKLEGKQAFTLEQEQFRMKRTMEILEQVQTNRAKDLLAAMAKGAPENAMADEAALSLKRVEKKKS